MSTSTALVTKPPAKAGKAAKALRVIPMSDETLHASHLMFLHRLVGMRGTQLKLACYFAGRAVQCLADEHGVSQGKKGTQGAVSWADFLRSKTGVPYRSAYRYQTTYQQMVAAHPDIAKKLNAEWDKMTATAALGNGKSGEADNATLATVELPAKALALFCDEPDVWGLHELFAKDEEEDAGGGDEEGGTAKARKDALIKFYSFQVLRRMKSGDFLYLPKAQLEAFATTTEEAAQAARAALEKKKGGKGK